MTAITAAVHAGPPRHVRISVTGAPLPPVNAYTSNFATVDGWAVSSGPGGVGVSLFPGNLTPKGGPSTTTPTIVSRTITGLTVGAQYRYRAVNPTDYPRLGKFLLRVRVTAGGADVATTPWLQPYNASQAYTAELVFTATATSMVIQLGVVYEPAGVAAQYSFSTITVQPAGSWTPPELHRTDANGGDVILDLYRNGAPEPATAAYVIDDWQAAHTGEIQYALVDGLGAVANTSVVVTPGMAGTGPVLIDTTTVDMLTGAAPAHVAAQMVTRYDAAREFSGAIHTIIGRPDKVANPGPLMLRAGRVGFLCETYADALAVESLVATGHTLQLLQADYPGLDMYFVGRQVELTQEETTTTRRWLALVTYEEVTP